MPKKASMPSDNAVTPTAKLRRENSERSTTGCFAVSSQITRKTSATSAMRPSVRIIGDANQSWSLPLSSMN